MAARKRRLDRSLSGLGQHSLINLPPWYGAAEGLGNSDAAGKPVFVESVARPGAAEPCAIAALNLGDALLGSYGRLGVLRVGVGVAPEGEVGARRARWGSG